MLNAFVIAGEPSGDALGADLLRGLNALETVSFDGIGGPLMQAEGLKSRVLMAELAVMGLTEVLPKLPDLLRRIRETADAIIETRPDILITIDSPDFCLRVAKRVKAHCPDLPIVHYVAPSVWAWRPGRAAKMARVVDHVLALLPFEPPYMEAAGMTCDFVGHPVATTQVYDAEAIAAFRSAHDIGAAPLLCLLPGSRRGEVRRQGAVYRDTAEQLLAVQPDLRIVLPMAAPVVDDVTSLIAGMSPRPILLAPDSDEKHLAFAASNAALAASGTVSLELARQSCPMVIGYQMAPLTRFLIKRMVKLQSATLVNIVTESQAVPECLFDRFTAENLTASLAPIFTDPVAGQGQIEAMEQTMTALTAPEPHAAARSVLRQLR